MPEVNYVTFGDYCRIAAAVLATSPEQIARLPRIALADSALSSPSAGFGGHDAYPDLLEKAAVLVEHLARNHPLPDGNKRCAFLALERFLAANGRPIGDADPDTDVPMVERIAAGEAPLRQRDRDHRDAADEQNADRHPLRVRPRDRPDARLLIG